MSRPVSPALFRIRGGTATAWTVAPGQDTSFPGHAVALDSIQHDDEGATGINPPPSGTLAMSRPLVGQRGPPMADGTLPDSYMPRGPSYG